MLSHKLQFFFLNCMIINYYDGQFRGIGNNVVESTYTLSQFVINF